MHCSDRSSAIAWLSHDNSYIFQLIVYCLQYTMPARAVGNDQHAYMVDNVVGNFPGQVYSISYALVGVYVHVLLGHTRGKPIGKLEHCMYIRITCSSEAQVYLDCLAVRLLHGCSCLETGLWMIQLTASARSLREKEKHLTSMFQARLGLLDEATQTRPEMRKVPKHHRFLSLAT